MQLEIIKYPDPILREVCDPIVDLNDSLRELGNNMLETMYLGRGIGLAAPQVGLTYRVFVMDVRPQESPGRYKPHELTVLESELDFPVVIFNPEIRVKEGETEYEEGCLSLPTYFDRVKRAEYVEVDGMDLDGNPLTIKTDGLASICIQHELDHLNGVLFIDHLSLVRANRIKNRIRKYGYEAQTESSSTSES